MTDLTRYTRERAARDPEFAGALESGYGEFEVGVLLLSPHATELVR